MYICVEEDHYPVTALFWSREFVWLYRLGLSPLKWLGFPVHLRRLVESDRVSLASNIRGSPTPCCRSGTWYQSSFSLTGLPRVLLRLWDVASSASRSLIAGSFRIVHHVVKVKFLAFIWFPKFGPVTPNTSLPFNTTHATQRAHARTHKIWISYIWQETMES